MRESIKGTTHEVQLHISGGVVLSASVRLCRGFEDTYPNRLTVCTCRAPDCRFTPVPIWRLEMLAKLSCPPSKYVKRGQRTRTDVQVSW